MDKRLIFRYRWRTIKSARGTGRGRRAVALELRRPSVRGASAPEAWGRLRDTKAHHAAPLLPEKPRAGSRQRPYRRPTQVGGCESTKVDG